MAKQSVSPSEDLPTAFDFAEYLFRLERALPKRSKARKLIPELEAYVAALRARAIRPWEMVNMNHGTSRDQAKTALFEPIMKIDPEHRFEVGVEPAMAACSLKSVPEEVQQEVETLLKRERNFCYIAPFITLRLKGDVTLTDKCTPVEGSSYARFQ